MSDEYRLTVSSRSWATASVQQIYGMGRIAPRIVLDLRIQAANQCLVTSLTNVRVRLVAFDELIGVGSIIHQDIYSTQSKTVTVEFPTSTRLIEYITQHVGQQTKIPLAFWFDGVLTVTWDPDSKTARMGGEPEPGIPTTVEIPPSQVIFSVSVARSDWFERVLSPTRAIDYRPLELFIPMGESANQWRKSLVLFQDAEKAYALGDDSSVFNHLKGVYDSLPGGPDKVLEFVVDQRHKKSLDALFKRMTEYLQLGRHVSKLDDDDDGFAVDHQDAGFALNLMRTLLSHLSLLKDRQSK